VVIFDEAQCLPPEYLRPCIFAVRELHQHYGVTPLLCTATQPVLTQTDRFDFRFKEGFENVVEIIEHPDALAAQLKRVRVTCLSREPVSFEKLHEAILSEGQSVLCIVNRKKDARILAGLLPDDQCIHLSTNMCAAHRLGVLQRVRERLKKDMQPLYVVSTSLVEAGVDLDFPIVYRAMAGLDSIAQAAGRCNREGNNPALGKTVVFVPDEQPGYVQSAASLAHEYLQEEKLPDVLLPETFADYFRHRFFMLGADTLDEKNILKRLPRHLDKIYFRTAAECFRLINDQWQLPLIVPFGKALERVDKLVEWDARRQFRKLQMFTISVPRKIMWHLIDEAHAKELTEFPGTYYLHNHALYTERFGFVPPDETECYEVEATIA
jgi:CRISPR-associated endonuclease/helicase Cas3